MAAPATTGSVDRVATLLTALEADPVNVASAALCLIDRCAEPRTFVGVFAGGRRFALRADEVDIAARVLESDQAFAGSRAIADGLRARQGMAELLRFRANAVRMVSPMGRG